MSVARSLASFVSGADLESAEDALAVMRLSLYDWVACGVAGAREPVSAAVRGLACAEGSVGDSGVFGTRQRLSARNAAWVNGATSHALDYDDTHFAHIGHPSVVVLSAALAVGGEDVLWAALIGAEASVRVGEWLGRSHYQVGFHQTATAGAFGAAAAAGRLMGLEAPQLEAAFGVVATQAAGLKSQFGTMGKPYHAGLAARTGVEAAQLAALGFDTRGAGVDGPQGFGATHHGAGNGSAFDGLGTVWRMTRVSHKFHACCHGLHAILEALAGFEGAAEDVARVEIRTHPRWLSVCNIAKPRTGLEVKFSYAHIAAMAMCGYDTSGLAVYCDEVARDPHLVELAERVEVIGDESISEMQADVRVEMADGSRVALVHDLDAPLAIEARAARLRGKGKALLGAREEDLWAAVQAKRAPDWDALQVFMSHPL